MNHTFLWGVSHPLPGSMTPWVNLSHAISQWTTSRREPPTVWDTSCSIVSSAALSVYPHVHTPTHTHTLPYTHAYILHSSEDSSTQSNSTSSVSPPPRRLSFLEAMAPGLPFCLMAVLYAVWISLSPSNILEREPRVFYFTLGIIFSNISVSNIVCDTQLLL